MQSRKYFWKKNRLFFGAALLSMVILSLYNLVVSWQLQVIIDIVAGKSKISLGKVAVIAAAAFLIFNAAYFVYRYARPKFLQRAMEQYRVAVFERMMKKKTSAFYRKNTAEYISAMTNDMGTIENSYLEFGFSIVDLGVSFVGAVLMMLWYSPVLALIAVVLSCIPMLAALPCTKGLTEKEKAVSEKNAVFIGTVKDILQGFSVVKGFRAEKEIGSLFAGENGRLEKAKCERNKAEETVNILSTGAGVVMQTGIFMIGAGMAVFEPQITPGIVLAFLQLVRYIISPIQSFPQLWANRMAAVSLMKKLDGLMQDDTGQDFGRKEIRSLEKGISVENLVVSYEEGHKILEHIDIFFETGKKYAIVGNSGSGKSTLLNTLMGGVGEYSGAVYYDGIELREIMPESVFDLVTLVQQNVFVFNDTVQNNITMFRNFEREELKRVYALAGLEELILQKGENYICGENGSALSGGEKQRISIARALLRGSKVIMLDEATAALDNQTSCGIIETILGMEDVTRIVVTHRLEEKLLRQYDEILVLNGGKIAERGSFEGLMESRGIFYSLYTIIQSQA